jgi:DEAD/DEAH box helicase domain-containing protein
MRDTIVLDLETQKTFEEVGGRDNARLLRVSLVGIYSYAQDLYRTFTEWETPGLKPILEEAGLVIGFNIKRFDYIVLEPYLKRSLQNLPTLDIMEAVVRSIGHRLSLNSLAQATLGHEKLGSGLDAIQYFRNGEIEKLKEYCLADVRLTRELYEYGRRHGRLHYRKDQSVYSIPVHWGTAQ